MTFAGNTFTPRHVQRVSKIEDGAHLALDFLLERGAFAGLLSDVIQVQLPEGTLIGW